MDAAPLLAPQLEQVWARLDLVMDPELDEPLTDMGFIEAVAITGPGTVAVSFRLPTYWCSPNFAFLMAEGIKREVETLPWVTQAVVTLEDHMAAAEMNAAINAGASFASVFADLQPDEDLSALQQTLQSDPAAGVVMPGCAGLRKLRAADPRRGMGKRGGVRVIYLHIEGADEIHFITVYGKDQKDDLSADDKVFYRKLVGIMKEQARRPRRS